MHNGSDRPFAYSSLPPSNPFSEYLYSSAKHELVTRGQHSSQVLAQLFIPGCW